LDRVCGSHFWPSDYYLVARMLVPESRSSKYDDVIRVATARNTIRATIAQIVAGLAFVATFIQTANNFNRDLSQKAEQSTADLFSKAAAQLGDPKTTTWGNVGTFYLLASIANGDVRYHMPVYHSLAQFILQKSTAECEGDKDKPVGYKMSPELNTAARVFAEREVKNDLPYRNFNLTGACLVSGDFLSTGGLSKLFMPTVKLFRADVRYAWVTDSDLSGMDAGVVHTKGWEEVSGWTIQKDARWRDFVTDFQGAHFERTALENAGFEGSNLRGVQFLKVKMIGANLRLAQLVDAEFADTDLKGVNFTGANIARTKFTRIKNLTAPQLYSACVRDPDEKEGQSIPSSKLIPDIESNLKKEVESLGGFQTCQ
jgi:uncharacterized protein YjbI with pentapeptide repeats